MSSIHNDYGYNKRSDVYTDKHTFARHYGMVTLIGKAQNFLKKFSKQIR